MSMYLAHFGLTEAPFKITPHTEFFFDGASRGETLEALIYAVMTGEGMVKVTGEVGAGKTMLCRVLMERLPREVETIYLAVPSISRDEILATIAGDLGIETVGLSTTKIIRALQQRLIDLHVANKQVVALIDEAHAMPLATLEEIRLLSNLETNRDKLMQIVLFGQPELDAHLSLPNMRQLRERITHSFNLQPLPARDIGDYLNFRLRQAGYRGPDLFRGEAVKVIAEASEGLTRRINIFADKTLLAAYADNTHDVTARHARAAVADTQITGNTTAVRQRRWPVPAALAAGLLIGGGAGYWLGHAHSRSGSAGATASAEVKPLSGAQASTPERTLPVQAEFPTDPPAKAAALPIVAEKSNEKRAAPAAGASSAPAAEVEPAADPVRDARTADSWLGERMLADLNRLASASSSGFAIQLMTADEHEGPAIREFLRVAAKELEPDRLMVFPSGSASNRKISVIYGQYEDRGGAQAEIVRLSPRLRQFRPFIRSVNAVRADVRATS
ncbi:MAG: AAA family ATPase [Betaproteobacteria bacterium]|nr:AAA family ATPase [Betaproteobacteria bacterium]